MFKKYNVSVKCNIKIYKTGIAHHLNALRAGVQVGNQFSSRIGYKTVRFENEQKQNDKQWINDGFD